MLRLVYRVLSKMSVLQDVVMSESFRMPRRFLMTEGELLMEVIAPFTSEQLGYENQNIGSDNVTWSLLLLLCCETGKPTNACLVVVKTCEQVVPSHEKFVIV